MRAAQRKGESLQDTLNRLATELEVMRDRAAHEEAQRMIDLGVTDLEEVTPATVAAAEAAAGVASSLAGVPAALRIGGEFRSEFARLMKKIVPDAEVWKDKLEAELAAAQHALDAEEAAALQGRVRYGEIWGDIGRYREICTSTSRTWPMRKTRPMACCSLAAACTPPSSSPHSGA